MQERSNSNDWRDRLDSLDCLPGEPWNKTGGWEKMELRLKNKPRYKKLVWYWAAAACLLSVAAIQWLKENRKEDLVTNRTTVEQAPKPVGQTRLLSKQRGNPLDAPATVQKRHEAASYKKEKDRAVAIKKVPVVNIYRTPDTALSNNSIAERIEEKILPGIVAVPVAVKPEKRRLKVIHVNELGKPVEEKTRLAQARRIASGESFLNKDVFTNAYTPDDNILKIKLSPNN